MIIIRTVKNTNNLSRRERERLRHREEILEAAKRVFTNSGYNSATMESIAVESEFSLATLYKFFGSKENLFMEILLQMIEEMEKLSEGIFNRSDSVMARITDHFYARMELHWKNPGLIPLVEDMIKTNNGVLNCLEDLKKRYFTYVNRLVLLFSEGITRGEFRDRGDKNLALSYEGMLHMYFGACGEKFLNGRDRKDEDNLLSVFLDGAAVPTNNQAS
jgi:TetR/AcrR family transcriptional regulator